MVKKLLQAVRSGRLSIDEAAVILRDGSFPGGPHARLDIRREERTGLPEIILAEPKPTETLMEIVGRLAEGGQDAIISRLTRDQLRALGRFPRAQGRLTLFPEARMAILGATVPSSALRGRRVAILTAGSADHPVASEAKVCLRAMGAEVVEAYDVGVAGLHRLLRALQQLSRRPPQVYLVFAGREGALPTVVAGLVSAPVIAIPTSVGYGRGARGEAALTAMLQSCAPLAVVNIDGGIPAALVAAQILRGMAPARGHNHRRE